MKATQTQSFTKQTQSSRIDRGFWFVVRERGVCKNMASPADLRPPLLAKDQATLNWHGQVDYFSIHARNTSTQLHTIGA
eukprot:6463516-Amphidinium_carterae.1